jgi:hypothetical protein
MKTYIVSICYLTMEKIEVRANNAKEAENIVNQGDYEPDDIVNHDTDDFQIVDCVEEVTP